MSKHHCPGGNHVFDKSRCPKKGHVVQCPVHHNVYIAPGRQCATCKVIVQAEERREKEIEKEKEKNDKKKKGT